MKTLRFDEAATVLDLGGLVVIPTETVYGLAGRPTPDVVDRIFEVKRRPSGKHIQLLIPSAEWLRRIAVASPVAQALATAFWPGPLTMVVPAGDEAPSALATDGSIGLRVPAHPIAQELLARCGPLAASSANESGAPAASTIAEIHALFGSDVDGYVDGGHIAGSGSTVVDLRGPGAEIVREGPITASDIAAIATSI